jgi:hypothetical protein
LAQSLPRFEAQNLSGTKLVFPDALEGKGAVFVVGFSRKSQEQTKIWSKRIAEEFRRTGKSYFQVAVLQSVPRLLRGVVVSGIRRGVPESQHDKFLVVYQEEDEWKNLVGYTAPDDAYVLVVDGVGRIVWKTHAVFTETEFGRLKSEFR